MDIQGKIWKCISGMLIIAMAFTCVPAVSFAEEYAASENAADTEVINTEDVGSVEEDTEAFQGILPAIGVADEWSELLQSSYKYKSQNESVIIEFLVKNVGLNYAAACGVLANIYYESAVDENAMGDYREASEKYETSGYTSYGICQWHDVSTGSGRWTNLKNYCKKNGYDDTSLTGQLYFLKYELETSYKSTLNYLKTVSNTQQGAYDAAYYWCVHFEVPADKENVGVTRGNYAKNTYWSKYINLPVSNVIPGTVVKLSNGKWYYCVDGEVDYTYTGVAKNSKGWWRIVKGELDWNCNSVEQNAKGWWYIVGGKVQFDYTGVANYANKNGWWYIKNGKVDFTANTVAKNKNGWWYVTGGKVQFGYTGVANYANKNGWWYIKNGKVDFTANTVAKNKNGWWYVKNGKVDFNYTGIASNKFGTWYIKKGKVDFSYTGTYKTGGKTYKVVKGKVNV